ncbi:sensor histidine kinase [Magnetospirillum sp. 15-1]|uniref:sensor histidine kinase n=1 Tax=Magnetospirillum sp. 15-1 TaxID=1979370 RepID=UPI000BBC0E80|nr:sensor histidine kinase [Magnetospirillum sp. 15-1]
MKFDNRPPERERLAVTPVSAGRLPSIRSKLVLLVMVCLLPSTLAVGLLIYDFYHRQRALLEQNMVQTAHALSLAVDREIASTVATLQTLATSPHLANTDLAGFYEQAQVVQRQQNGDNIVLSDASAQQVVNLKRPLGTPLPRHGAPEQIEKVLAAGRPAVSDLFMGGVIHRPLISVDVPVWKNGKAVYDISMAILPEHLGHILTEQQLPPGWIAAIFDSRGIIIARTHQPEKFVGQSGTPILVERMRQSKDGLSENNTLEGIPVYGAFSRSEVAQWSVAVGVPKQVLLAELRDSILLVCISTLALTIVGLGLAWMIGGQIRRSVRSLIEPALALGSGADISAPRQDIREVEELARALATASALLQRRTAERDQARRNEAETQRLLQELIDANGELQRFAHIASHDLQEPLRTVTSFTQLLARRLAGRLDSEADEYMEFIVGAAKRMHELINGLLTFANVSGQGQVMGPVSAAQACRAALDNLHDSIVGSGAEITVGDLPVVVATEVQLMQVFQNLIGNAIKFRRPDRPPRIAVTAEPHQGLWLFSVADNGIGVEKSEQDIFQIFRRLHTSDAYPGTGVGLAVCKRIIQGGGGEIWLEPNPTGGSIFRFTVPAPSDEAS